MRVFLSSVRRGLEEERDSAASVLDALGHEVIRFEDFGALDRPSRDACLSAVRSADAYVLLLGPHYGTTMPDTRLSPTEEEFNTARASGRPRLVFTKDNIDMDSDQAEFAGRVGGYSDGRFWDTFEGPGDLAPKLISAMRGLPTRPVEPEWRLIPTRPVVPVHDERGRQVAGQPAYTSVLELHVIPDEPVPLRPVSARESLARQISQRARTTRFMSDADPVEPVRMSDGVHVRCPSQPDRQHIDGFHKTVDRYRGVIAFDAGPVVAYLALPSDTLGSLTNEADLTDRLRELLDQAIPLLPPHAADVLVTALLVDEGRTRLGDPASLGHRHSGTLAYGQTGILLPADRSVSVDAVKTTPTLVARELAARLAHQIGTDR